MVEEGEESSGKGERELVRARVGAFGEGEGGDTVSDERGKEAVIGGGSSCLNNGSKSREGRRTERGERRREEEKGGKGCEGEREGERESRWIGKE